MRLRVRHLDVPRLDDGSVQCHEGRFETECVYSSSVSAHSSDSAKGQRKIVLLPGFEGEVEALASELRQVFTNVLKNAVEATAEDGDR